ncbi:hypothetical protein VNI00_012523 [Paramarasmius palmivorus]|uniref:Ketoreductase domain-containing protein n=1 Tax=Paramarasmius palmivorus TaxID=297713 RepID=A0AAW0C448_9AGAR
MKIENRTFVVSGGSSGLGLATVRELLSAQGYVAILDRKTPPSLDEIARDGSSDRSHLLFVEMNILKVEEVESAVEKVVSWSKETGAHLGGLINGAGVAEAEVLINLNGVPHSERLWNRVIGINLNGTFHLTRLLVPHLIHVPPEDTADAERGVVVMISSTVAVSDYEGLVGQIAYAASKGAIRSMTLPMARDLARYNIRTVTLAPGPFTTPMTSQVPFSKFAK